MHIVRYDTSGFGTTSFIELPQSEKQAVAQNSTTATPPTSPTGLESLVLYCHVADYTICIFFDDTGYIAGLQIAVSIKYNYFMEFLRPRSLFTFRVGGEVRKVSKHPHLEEKVVKAIN